MSIAFRFAESLESLTLKQDVESCKITIQRLEKLFEYTKAKHFSNTDLIASRLTSSLKNLNKKDSEKNYSC